MKPWERSLWHLYDCTDYAANLAMLPTVAYAGEIDGQKQASDMMEKAMAAEGLKMERRSGRRRGISMSRRRGSSWIGGWRRFARWGGIRCRITSASRRGRCDTTTCSGSN